VGDEEADLLSDDLLPVLDDPLLGYVGLGGVKADADLVFYADESGNTRTTWPAAGFSERMTKIMRVDTCGERSVKGK
jgi:hypothetical protein